MVSLMITNVLKGNPRQTKRFLNTFVLRQKLAEVAHISIENLVLIKLMLLEYFNDKLFNKLNNIQAINDGIVKELQLLESNLIDGIDIEELDSFKEWTSDEQIINWIKLEPRLSEVDLRDYFWLARDKTGSTLSNVHMVSPKIQYIYKGLIDDNNSKNRVSLESAKNLNDSELHELLNLFESNIQAIKDIKKHLISLHDLIIQINQYIFFSKYLDIYKSISYTRIDKLIFIPDKLLEIKIKETAMTEIVDDILETYSKQSKGMLKNASKKLLDKGDN